MTRIPLPARVHIVYAILGAVAALGVVADALIPTGVVSVGGGHAAQARPAATSPAVVVTLVNQAFAAQGQQAQIVAIAGCDTGETTTCRVVVQTPQGAVCARLSYRDEAGRPRVTEFAPVEPRQCQAR